MSSHTPWYDATPPPPLEEGYWEALLREGEHAEPVSYIADMDAIETLSFGEIEPENLVPANAETQNEDWEEIACIQANDQVITTEVIGYNRGGLLVEWHTLRGFVPASQLIQFPATAPLPVRRSALAERIGQKLELRVIELNMEQNRLIFSERAARAEAGERAHILNTLITGDTVTGAVTNLCDFGAFVDLGGLEGLIHISELSWGRVAHPMDMLKRGEQVTAYVLNVDPQNSRIALSLKRLIPDPWRTVNERYTIGQIVRGTVTNVVDFGAFACIEPGLEGLIHVSELAEGHFLHPRNVVMEGQQIEARILSIDSQARRLGLSLRLTE